MRRLPHAHIVMFLHLIYKNSNPSDIDAMIFAEIPNKDEDEEFYLIIRDMMMHDLCSNSIQDEELSLNE